MMDLEAISGMTVELGLGVDKSRSRWRTQAEFSETWDELARQVAAIKAAGMEVDIPAEWAPADPGGPRF